ncbi:hypothetical protein OHS81_01980 [Streptomyces sp. NBC_00400]|uniref:hypothetical protein n=1 Tax=Streptomyces sp. NBC_00400 TaxID=2975737 RepID=UPI002E238E70
MEVEVEEFLGRAHYQRAGAAADGEAGETERAVPVVRGRHHNGHREATIKTTSGPVTVARPRVRGTTEACARVCSAPR